MDNQIPRDQLERNCLQMPGLPRPSPKPVASGATDVSSCGRGSDVGVGGGGSKFMAKPVELKPEGGTLVTAVSK